MDKESLFLRIQRWLLGKPAPNEDEHSRLILFPKKLPDHLDAVYFEEYIRVLRMPIIWGTLLVFLLIIIAIAFYASSYVYIVEWFITCLVVGAITLLEIFWFWDVSARWGYRTQLTILNIMLGLLVSIVTWGVRGSWETMSQGYIGMMTTIVGAILGAAAVILSHSRVSFLVFMLMWILPGAQYMLAQNDPFFIQMGFLFISGAFSFAIINALEYAKQRQLFEARHQLKEINLELLHKDSEIDQELLFAAHIQMGIFPESRTQAGPFRIQTTILPLGRISGDYCDIVPRGDVTYALMADASGHGVPAAMLTMAAKNVFSNALVAHASPSSILASVNREILKLIKTQDYLTGFLLKLYPSGLVEFTNAAHPTAIFQSRHGDMKMLDTSGFILGGLDDVDSLYETASVQMHKGDRIFLYTDGVTECENAARHFYGVDRLQKMLRITRGIELSQVTTRIFSDMVTFSEGVAFRDDIAMMVVELEE